MAVKEVKVSFHSQTANKKTAAHNDRSMYDDKEKRGDETLNVHWDCYGLGSSVDAERRFYDEHFTDLLLAQNERYIAQRHPERCKDMDAYMEAHPVHESVMAIGNKDNQVPPGYLERIVPVIKEMMAERGCHLISLDIHYDAFTDEDGVLHEATPHLHARWMGIDKTGKPNINGALAEHGIEREKPGAKRSRYNNELKVFTAMMRERLEAEADVYLNELNEGLALSRERDPEAQHHDDIPTYRRRARAKEREQQADIVIEAAQEAARHDIEHVMFMAELAAEQNAQVMRDVILADAEEEADQRATEIVSDAQKKAVDVASEALVAIGDAKDKVAQKEAEAREAEASALKARKAYEAARKAYEASTPTVAGISPREFAKRLWDRLTSLARPRRDPFAGVVNLGDAPAKEPEVLGDQKAFNALRYVAAFLERIGRRLGDLADEVAHELDVERNGPRQAPSQRDIAEAERADREFYAKFTGDYEASASNGGFGNGGLER